MGASYRCDIIVATWNKLDYIKECVESILKYTDVKSRLIIVDNASEEDTRAYLKGLRGTDNVDIKLIFNDTNLGPGRARNRALEILDADYACFADSDIVVTPGWLSVMIALAEANPDIGMVNPSSNNFNQVPPDDVSLGAYSRMLTPFADSFIEVGHCISFCMLIKAQVVEKIGLIDEEYILALYEDTDYSMKASSAGYHCVIARGAYVWHYGHGSTGRVKKINDIAEKNRERFYKKWGAPLRILWCSAAEAMDEAFGEVLASAIELARDGNYVYVLARGKNAADAAEVFKRFGLVRHANVHVSSCPSAGFGWSCLWKVLIKRKKPYNLVIADGSAISLLGAFSIFYKAMVVGGADFDEVLKTAHDLKFKKG
jgi:GT2 family glycosyltransferase